MVFLTPPPSTRKDSKTNFMKPTSGLPYYEDLYGQPNEDEAFDRFPDVCEEESSSGDESVEHTPQSFFARFRGPKSRKSGVDTATGLGGEIGVSERVRGKGSGIFDFLPHRSKSTSPSDEVEGEPTYKITPSQNKKLSLPTTQINDKDKQEKKPKLTPKKGGLFASSFPSFSNTDVEMDNTAGEAMDDLLRAGAEASFGASFEAADMYAFDEGFALLDESTATYPAISPADYASPGIGPKLLLEDAKAEAEAEARAEDSGVEGVGFDFNSINPGVRAGEEGDVEDNASVSPTAKTSRGRDGKRAMTSLTATGTGTGTRKPAVANTKTKILHPAAGTRTSTRIAKTQPTAASPPGKKQAKTKAAQLQTKNQGLMTARAATLRGGKKARKMDTNKALPLRGSAGGRSVRLRNWRGEVIDEGDGKGVVVICAEEEETDGEGYELC